MAWSEGEPAEAWGGLGRRLRLEAFANLYVEIAAPPAFPAVRDGARGIAFICAAKQSSAANGAWTAIPSIEVPRPPTRRAGPKRNPRS